MAGIWIDGHFEMINSEEDFFKLVNEKIGYDGEKIGRQIVREAKIDNCSGECDYTYRQQEHYERVFEDLLDDLSNIRVPNSCQNVMSKLILKYKGILET